MQAGIIPLALRRDLGRQSRSLRRDNCEKEVFLHNKISTGVARISHTPTPMKGNPEVMVRPMHEGDTVKNCSPNSRINK